MRSDSNPLHLLLEIQTKKYLYDSLAVSLVEPLSFAPTAQLGWPGITFGAPQGNMHSSYCLL